MIKVLKTTLIVENSMIVSFSLFRSSYLIWMAPANSMKLSIPSRSNSLKFMPGHL